METPVLSKLQKKLSLSGKKQKKEIMKNVVDNPHQAYWPLICEELPSLVEVLSKNLPRVRIKKVNVPWKVLKDIPREERRKARNEFIQKNNPPVEIIVEPNLIFGVNDVTKSLESNLCSVVLVTEVTPRLLIKHIIDLSVLNGVPILVIPRIGQILEEYCGLRSIAVAIKRNLPKESNLNKIIEAVVEISKKYPVHSTNINLERRKKITKSREEKIDKINCNRSSTVEEKIEEPSKISGCHLHRTSLTERVFVPSLCDNIHYGKSVEISNFLSFNSLETNASEVSKKELYKPLRVKRLRGNKSRQKNKIEQLKAKKKK